MLIHLGAKVNWQLFAISLPTHPPENYRFEKALSWLTLTMLYLSWPQCLPEQRAAKSYQNITIKAKMKMTFAPHILYVLANVN